MDSVVIEGVPPYDGRWPLEGQELTTREWGWIKRLSGYLPLTIDEGYGDPELITVFACIALTRAQKATPAEVPRLWERLIDVPYRRAIRLEADEEKVEDDADPPPSSGSENGGSSGAASNPSSETLVIPPNRSGTTASASSESVPSKSAP